MMQDDLWFPNVIWNSTIDDLDNDNLIRHVYEKVAQDKIRPPLGAPTNQAWTSVSLVVEENNEVKKLVDRLNEKLYTICDDVGMYPVQLYDIWANVNPPGVANHLHAHQPAIFSGVYYLDAEEGQGDIIFERDDGGHTCLPVLVKEPTPFNQKQITYKSVTDACYVFPGWLKHKVAENTLNKDRLSISFNYGV
tara:strand:- start:616 stop:1194 length:579 start_codon:yes stop_codon:yes gene_type:complete